MTDEAALTLDSAVTRLREVFTTAEPALTALDEHSGDGDFGVNLREGFDRAAERLSGSDAPSPWATVREVFLDEVGGTSGPLFGLLFQSLALAAAGPGSYRDVLATGIRSGLAAIQRVGEAEVGDRTLVDALAPAAEALAHGSDNVAEMLREAVNGALSTGHIRARHGRASYLGDRALGRPDPGAVGVALVLSVLAEPILGTAPAADERRRLLAE